MVVFMLTSFRAFISKKYFRCDYKFYEDLKFFQHIFIFLELQLNLENFIDIFASF
jgi:hypothetical protein